MSPDHSTTSDRRHDLRRDFDRWLWGAMWTAISGAVALGIAWGTATAKVAQKVDRVEQIQIDAKQDLRLDRIDLQNGAMLDAIKQVQASVDSANVRLRQLACNGRELSCR